MYERGRQDAEADALDENYYQYYYEYKLAYDEVVRNRRRSRRQRLLGRIARFLLLALPIILILGALAYAGRRYIIPEGYLGAARTPTPTRTPRPTLIPPTDVPPETPTPELVLRVDGFAVITGTEGAPLRAHTAPGTDTSIVTRFREGQTAKVLEGPQEAGGLQWWRVEVEGKSGWAAASFLQPVPPPP